jgi:hypothetical protein
MSGLGIVHRQKSVFGMFFRALNLEYLKVFSDLAQICGVGSLVELYSRFGSSGAAFHRPQYQTCSYWRIALELVEALALNWVFGCAQHNV